MLYITNQTSYQPNENMLNRIIELALVEEEIDTYREVNLLFADNETIKDLNKRYRGKNAYTDVLSFPADATFVPLIGDIIIDINVATAQKGNRTLDEEIGFLFLHGLLHLLGYDHLHVVGEKQMYDKQDRIWQKLKEI